MSDKFISLNNLELYDTNIKNYVDTAASASNFMNNQSVLNLCTKLGITGIHGADGIWIFDSATEDNDNVYYSNYFVTTSDNANKVRISPNALSDTTYLDTQYVPTISDSTTATDYFGYGTSLEWSNNNVLIYYSGNKINSNYILSAAAISSNVTSYANIVVPEPTTSSPLSIQFANNYMVINNYRMCFCCSWNVTSYNWCYQQVMSNTSGTDMYIGPGETSTITSASYTAEKKEGQPSYIGYSSGNICNYLGNDDNGKIIPLYFDETIDNTNALTITCYNFTWGYGYCYDSDDTLLYTATISDGTATIPAGTLTGCTYIKIGLPWTAVPADGTPVAATITKS